MTGFFDFIKKSGSNATPPAPGVMPPPMQTTAPAFPIPPSSDTPPVIISTQTMQNPVVSPLQPQAVSGIGTPQASRIDERQAEKANIQAMLSQPLQPLASQTPASPHTVAPTKTDTHKPASAQHFPTIPKKDLTIASKITDQKRGEIDVMTHLTQRSNRVFLSANNKAKELKNAFIDSEHILHGLLSDGEIYKLLIDLKIQPQMVEDELVKMYKKEASTIPPQMSPRVKRIIDSSLVIARKLSFEFISPEHILMSLFEEGEGIGARVLVKLGLKKEDLNKKVTGKKEGIAEDQKETEKKKNIIDQFTVDLTAKASQGLLDPVVERSDVIERVIHILSRRTKNNPALVGEAGVGKTAIVEGLAQKIVSKQVPESLLGKRMLQLDLMGILAGASHRGEFEERMKNLVEEVQASQGKIILFIDEIHTIVGAGSSGDGTIDASNFLKPALARGEIQLIGATTLTEYRKYIEKDPALERRFQPILVAEPTEEQAIKMLKSIREKYEAFHKVRIPDAAVDAAVKLSKRYVGDRFLPDKAVDLIDEAASAVRLPLLSLPEEMKSLEDRISELKQESAEAQKAGDQVKVRINNSKLDDIQAELSEKKEAYEVKKAQTTSEVTEGIIKDVVSRWTGIPVAKISGSEMAKLANLEKIMHERMIGQEAAVTSVAEAVRRGRAGLKSTKRPIGSFVFLGPTGVGKTELAKTLADVLFGQEEAMVRFDMTEYMEKHEVAKLLGAPPGYVGYEEGGKLTEAVRRKPYSVVLFDEVEKAHPDIFNILLQILDDGRLTDNKGHVISFKNTVVICTSNIGSVMIQDEMLKEGKTNIGEPPLLSTYTFLGDGKEMLTIGSKYFTRSGASSWTEGMLLDYFSNKETETTENPPIQGYDTHAVSLKGEELITKNDTLFQKVSGDSGWKKSSLGEYFTKHTVTNAVLNVQEEQLPTVMLKTHAFAQDGSEVVTFKGRFWRRRPQTTEWETGELKDYFTNQTAESGTLPTSYWDIHTVASNGREIIVAGENIWFREANTVTWKQQAVKEYFGADFPLESEVEVKKKVDEEMDTKKFELLKVKVMNELRKFFRPELINRFDEVIIFEPLKFSHMTEIVKLQLKGVGHLLEDQDMGFACTDAAVKEIVQSGFDPVYGARPLRRAIQKLIENPMSSLIIEGKLKPGDSIQADFDGNAFVFNIEKVTLVPASSVSGKISTFTCAKCQTTFQTEVLANSTTICKNCASSEVRHSSAQDTTPPPAAGFAVPENPTSGLAPQPA